MAMWSNMSLRGRLLWSMTILSVVIVTSVSAFYIRSERKALNIVSSKVIIFLTSSSKINRVIFLPPRAKYIRTLI